jgi:HD-GYP domain-containing protein (c-di-GMP phosphodiesterase class II)
MAFLPIKNHELRKGLYVRLNGSWFSHPFPTNTFKIRTKKELHILQKLNKVEILFDPERSDPEGVDEELLEEISEPSAEEVPEVVVAEVTEVPEAKTAVVPEDIPVRLAPTELFAQYCEGFKKADRAYQEAFRQSKAVMQDLSVGNIEGIQKAHDMVCALGDLLDGPDATTSMLNVMMSNEMGQGMFMHSLNVCALCLMIGKEFDLREDEIHELALGAVFHDIGELNVPGKILLKRPNLSPSERDTYRQHPRFGKDMVRKFSAFPKLSMNVIYQHHERLDGSGYPMGLKGEGAISLFARIVMVVDRYDDLCNDPDIEKRLTPSEALSHLFVKQKTVFWSEAVVALVRVLGVYPPGSLVLLSNEAIGMVVNINISNRLRPLILLYSEGGSSNRAQVLDLEEHEDITICQNLRPRDVSREAAEFLNPRQMVNYLVENTPAELATIPH